MKLLLFLRSYPGSGKTTIGKKIELAGFGKFIDRNSILNFLVNLTSKEEPLSVRSSLK